MNWRKRPCSTSELRQHLLLRCLLLHQYHLPPLCLQATTSSVEGVVGALQIVLHHQLLLTLILRTRHRRRERRLPQYPLSQTFLIRATSAMVEVARLPLLPLPYLLGAVVAVLSRLRMPRRHLLTSMQACTPPPPPHARALQQAMHPYLTLGLSRWNIVLQSCCGR